MNQILVTEKLYITPELKRKKKIYKLYFFLSVFLVCILISLYIYAEYDRNKNEETSAALLEEFNQDEQEIDNKKKVLVAVLDGTDEGEVLPVETEKTTPPSSNNKKTTTANGYTYSSVASINIPKINVNYTIIDGETDSVEETEALLKISPTKFWGPDANTVGNYCIVGHNYRNSKFFSKVPTLNNGDIIEITDDAKNTVKYSVYANYEVVPNDTSCLDQETNGKREITLITCTNDSKLRVIVKAREV